MLVLPEVHSQAPKAEAGGSLRVFLVEVLCFCIAAAVIRQLFPQQRRWGRKGNRAGRKTGQASLEPCSCAAWRLASRRGPLSNRDVQGWAAKVFAEEPGIFVDEFVGHLANCPGTPQSRDLAHLLLDIPARAGRPDVVKEFARATQLLTSVEVDRARQHEALVSASALGGQMEAVEKLLAKESLESGGNKVSLRSMLSATRGYLKCGKLQEAIGKLSVMCHDGYEVPPGAVVELAHAACRHGADLLEVLTSLPEQLEPPAEAISVMFEHCLRTDDLRTACGIQALVKRKNLHLSQEAYESLLKLHSKVDSAASNNVLAEMLAYGFAPCEGICRFAIARCAETQNIALAEALARVLRCSNEMSFQTYKTLMKAYACASLYEKACDLYMETVAAGMKPDSVMLESLMKFSVKAGRMKLAQEIFEQLREGGGGSVQSYMWLIRAAGQQGDVERATGIFRTLQQEQPKLVDAMAFNITIDACASNKEMPHAATLFKEMQQANLCNHVTYNTLMKGHIATGDLQSAKGSLYDMKAAGFVPDFATFCCLLGGSTRLGGAVEVWAAIEEMERHGFALDSYCLCSVLQAARRMDNSRDAEGLLSILDRTDVHVSGEETVFSTALDACVYRRDRQRLARAIEAYHSSSCKVLPTVRTFGLLIKASSVLKRTSRCWEYWNDMVSRCGLLPSDVALGCMIDALVEAEQVEEAWALFQQWQHRVKCDTIVYSTLIKGFANLGAAERAMDLHRYMKSSGIQTNHIVYTALIHAHARGGLMEKAEALLGDMQQAGFEPNARTYSSLVKGYCVQGELEAALGLFHKMVDLGFEADSVIFNTLIDGCVHTGHWPLADNLLAEMRRLQVQPTKFTLSVMVKMWSKRHELEKAFQCVYEALRAPAGFKLVDAQVGACIVGACIHNRSPERALQVFEDMKRWRNFDGPDANTYSALISGLARHGLVRKAAQLAGEACDVLFAAAFGQDCRPLAASALQQLFRSLKQEGLLDELGRPLEAKLRKAGMKLDSRWLI